jgi:uncharacterized protein
VTPRVRPRVLLSGVSVRALAESAARAGWDVTALDAYGDLDLERIATVLAPPRGAPEYFDQLAAARASRRVAVETVAYVSSFENAPEAVGLLARGRTLLGNPPSVLRSVRDPLALARALSRNGVRAPAVRAAAPRAGDGSRWLLKPRHSGGGRGIVRWRRGMSVSRSSVVQERVRGIAGSIIFAADGRQLVPIALTRQLVGDPAFGARGFVYCGSILEPHRPALLANAIALASHIVRDFELRGVCSVDFIAQGAVPFAIEVNPRATASMELAERASGCSVWHAHVAGCTRTLDASSPRWECSQSVVEGKAVLYARRTVVLGDTTHWLDDDDVRDVPHPGERIARGRPICTIFARGRTSALCHAALVRCAQVRYAEVERRMRRKSA